MAPCSSSGPAGAKCSPWRRGHGPAPLAEGGALHHSIQGAYKKLLGAPGIATRSKDATRGSWPYY